MLGEIKLGCAKEDLNNIGIGNRYVCKMENNMKRYMSKMLTVMLALLVLASCAVTDIDRTVNFNSYRTYAWSASEVNVKNPAYRSDLIDKNIKSAVENEFAKRGIVRNDADPDFFVSYKTYTEQQERTRGGAGYAPYPFYPFGFSPFRFGWGWGMPFYGGSYPQTETVTEGTLIVDVVDAKTKGLVWRGSVSSDVNSVKNLQRQLEKGVKAILKKYPVTPQEPLDVNTEKPIS